MGGWGLLNGKEALEIAFMPDLNLSLPLTREKQMFRAGEMEEMRCTVVQVIL